jgi:hypothetical protein
VKSTTESEYITASKEAKKGIWIKVSVVPSMPGPMEIYCDNIGAISQAKEPSSHQKKKYIVQNITSSRSTLRKR